MYLKQDYIDLPLIHSLHDLNRGRLRGDGKVHPNVVYSLYKSRLLEERTFHIALESSSLVGILHGRHLFFRCPQI